MTSESAKDVVRDFIEVMNGHDLDHLPDVLADDFSLPVGGGRVDRNGLRAVLTYYFAAFPDLHYEVKDLIAEGDAAVVRVMMTGTHSGAEYGGQAATGNAFAVWETDWFRVIDDRIASYEILWDELGFRRQLGLPLDA